MRKRSCVLVLLAGLLIPSLLFAQTDTKSVLDLVKANAKQLHLSAVDRDNMVISSFHPDKSGITYVYVQQAYRQINVRNSILSLAFKNGQLIYSSGLFVQDIETKALQSSPSVTAVDAAGKAAQILKLTGFTTPQILQDKMADSKKMVLSAAGVARNNIEAELVWVPADNKKTVKLAWNINIDVAGSSDWWNVRINAADGSFISKDNWTVKESHSAASDHQPVYTPLIAAKKKFRLYTPPSPPNVTTAIYNVIPFPIESPNFGSPAQVTNPWNMAGTGNNATTNGWHYDGTTNYNITRGNNVFAYLDITATNSADAINNWPDTSSTSAPALNFINTYNFSGSPATRINKKFSVDNLFYWNNLMHDIYYQYGFTEAAGNFQKDNLSRGGVGNDWVNAQALDGAGTDNANMSVPIDGANGRMRMYWFSDTANAAIMTVDAPASIAGSYTAKESAFSVNNLLIDVGPITGQVVYFNDDVSGAVHFGCGSPVNSISGKIALINRGAGSTCSTFVEKVKNAQLAGAIGVIMVNNVPGAPIIMGAATPDNTITIPAVMISQADGAIIAAQLATGVTVTLAAAGKDGGIDNGIITHEYGHGISIRLTGGPSNSSCLSNAEEGGEGWSDYFALMTTTNWATATTADGTKARPVGTYAVSDPATGGGIRRHPYSTNMTIDPITYADMAGSTEVHDIGEIWCSALWDMTWNIIQQQNSIDPNIYNSAGTSGNVVALNLVLMGLKLQPCSPGYLDARDAILAADSILYNSAHRCAIWNAFARRGMGVSAIQGSSDDATDQAAAYDIPGGVSLSRGSVMVVTSGQSFAFSNTATCGCQPVTGYVIRDTIPTGFTVVNSTPAGTLNGNVYSYTVNDFAASEVKNFNLTLQATSSGCAIDTVINDNRETSTVGGMTAATVSGIGTWASSTVRAHSGANSWMGSEPTTPSVATLTSGAFAATSGQNLSILSFWHYYNTEKTYDGGVLEYSTDGSTWNDASPFVFKNKYNNAMDASTVLAGQNAYTGSNMDFQQTLVNLSSFGTTPVKIRFRMTADNGTSVEGWYVDDIIRANGCGGIVKTAVYDGSNNIKDTIITPIFVKVAVSTITINTQPANTTVCAGANANFTIAASSSNTITYQWQVSTDGGATFTDIAGQTTSTLTLNAVTAGMNNYQYHCIVADGTSPLISSAATLTVNTSPAITTQPVDKTACTGTSVSFTVAASGSGTLTYQWQVSTDGGTTYNSVSGATNSTLTFTAAATQNGYKYKCIITNTCGNITTNVVTLTVINASIDSQPTDVTICAGSSAVFSISATGASAYQWQVSTDGGTTYNNVSGATTNSLSLSSVTVTQNNYKYRCVVTTGCGILNSSSATLTVNAVPAITTQPVDKTVCVGNTVSFAVAASGSGTLTYQWQVSTDGGATYTDVIGAANTTLSFTTSVGQNNNKYRCVVTSGSCGSVTSNAVTLTVVNAGINTQPANVSTCSGSNADFILGATGATAYQWQVSTNGGTSFSDVTGATSATLTLSAVTAGMNTYQYHCTITTGCGPITSSAAILTVNTSPSITTQPADITVCTGAAISFTVAASGSGTLTYQWQVSTDGGATFNNISGATSTSFPITTDVSQNNNKYRCIVSSATCGSVASNIASLTVVNAGINTQPSDVSVCAGISADFTLGATGASAYQWQISTNGGSSYTNISGATSAAYSVNPVTLAMSGNKFRCVITTGCGALNSAAATLTVTNGTTLTLGSLPSRICATDSLVQLSGTPAGGVWTGSGITGSIFNPSLAGVGTYTLTYTYTSSIGCVSSDDVTAVVDNCADRQPTLAMRGIIIYPNPSDGQFSILVNTSRYTYLNMRIYNNLGQLIKLQTFDGLTYGTVIPINLKYLSTGSYQLRMSSSANNIPEDKTFQVIIAR